MKRKIRLFRNNTIIVFSILFFVGCISVQEKTNYQPDKAVYQQRIADRPDATYDKDVLPFIIKQINDTAAFFFYDIDKANRNFIDQRLPPIYDTALDVIVGNNETGGVCADYTNHFIDNYRGLGEIYYVCADIDGTTSLLRKVKPFEKSDIIINDTMTVEDFREKIYQWVINSRAKQNGSRFIWQDKNGQWATFYTRTRNGTIYWTKDRNNLYPAVPFGKEQIQINYKNYQAERNRESKEYIDRFYEIALHNNRENKGQPNWGRRWFAESDNKSAGWYIAPINLYTDNDGITFLVEKTPIPTPLSHAGKKDGFFDHAWVRIIWRDMVIDIDPTWYDNGTPIEYGAVEEVKPGKENSFPMIYTGFLKLSNTKLIYPVTGTLNAGKNYTFIISSTDYSAFAVVIGDEVYNFSKNNDTGNFELNLTIPKGVDTINIFQIAKNGNTINGIGLLGYNVIK
ncbi:MAG: hypothetical protein FWF26_00370 [Treponema sp.]|nr:hypothetical protein [Treponema sp.]